MLSNFKYFNVFHSLIGFVGEGCDEKKGSACDIQYTVTNDHDDRVRYLRMGLGIRRHCRFNGCSFKVTRLLNSPHGIL